jgi:hypothetical protein
MTAPVSRGVRGVDDDAASCWRQAERDDVADRLRLAVDQRGAAENSWHEIHRANGPAGKVALDVVGGSHQLLGRHGSARSLG